MYHILKQLGFSESKNIYKYQKQINIDSLPLRINKSLHAMTISPEYIFILKNKPIVLFFSKQSNLESIFKQCWNFSESPIIIIENKRDFEIYNGYEYILENGHLLLDSLSREGLNYTSVISGKYIQQLAFKNRNSSIDKLLLSNIKEAREKLIFELLPNTLKDKRKFNQKKQFYELSNLTQSEQKIFSSKKAIANSLIGRIIFIRYLIDRQISIGFRKANEILSNENLINILSNQKETYQLFKYLKSNKGFNGDWFPISPDEENIIHENHLQILKDLISGYDFKRKQGTLFNFYDFSIIPIEFISNVYESFIGEDEQAENGAYYTPTFLVDYILKHTIDEYFKKHPDKYNCKVLDPACGSGIFLVETLRKLISQFENVMNREATPYEIVKLVKDNIYGIDQDSNAVLISVFSLYLTMLDYQKPKDIEKFLFPYLLKSNKNPNPNFFNNDFFDTEAPFNNILLNKELDFIIGNPPYGRSTIKRGSLADQYIKCNNISIANQDLVQAFMVRVRDLFQTNTKVSFIITSKVLYNLQSKEFRTNYFFNKFKITHILELSSVMSDIFENAEVPVSILFYESSCEKDILKNSFHYISMKPNPYFDKLKILLLSKNDYKKVSQQKLLENDYLWKILVYGSYLDFNFIKRLKEYKTINSYIDSTNIGITVGNKKNRIPQTYIGMPYVQTKQFKQFYIEPSHLKWEGTHGERVRTLDVFKAPSLLISKGISVNLDLKMGLLKENSIFSGTITALKCTSEDTLYGIMGFLNSSFFKYFTMHTASSIGIERPQIHNPEKFSLPYIESKAIVDITRKIEKNIQENFFSNGEILEDLKKNLDEKILKTFNLNEQEYALIDYSSNILIPWIMHKQYDNAFKKLSYQSKELEIYANIFIKYFTAIYKQQKIYFQTEILYNEYVIGMRFTISNKEYANNVVWKKEDTLDKFIKLSGNQPLEKLFIQKDIKGFEQNSFYIIKPNEYKNWHKAIGYLDFFEFRDAILKAGHKQWKN